MIKRTRTNLNLPIWGVTHPAGNKEATQAAEEPWDMAGMEDAGCWGNLSNALLLGTGRTWRPTPLLHHAPGVHPPGCTGSLWVASYMWVGAGSAGQTVPGFQEELKHRL